MGRVEKVCFLLSFDGSNLEVWSWLIAAHRSVHETKASSDQPAIKWEEQSLEVLHDRAQVGLDLHFGPSTVLCPREAVALLRFGKQPLAFPHSLGYSLEECRLFHLSLYLLKEILIQVTHHETLV